MQEKKDKRNYIILIKDCDYINVYKNFVPLLLKEHKDINEAFTKNRNEFILNLQII